MSHQTRSSDRESAITFARNALLIKKKPSHCLFTFLSIAHQDNDFFESDGDYTNLAVSGIFPGIRDNL